MFINLDRNGKVYLVIFFVGFFLFNLAAYAFRVLSSPELILFATAFLFFYISYNISRESFCLLMIDVTNKMHVRYGSLFLLVEVLLRYRNTNIYYTNILMVWREAVSLINYCKHNWLNLINSLADACYKRLVLKVFSGKAFAMNKFFWLTVKPKTLTCVNIRVKLIFVNNLLLFL